MINPITVYIDYFSPEVGYESEEDRTRVRAMLFFIFFGILAGVYSALKWHKADIPALAWGSSVLVFGPQLVAFLTRFRAFSTLTLANLAVLCMTLYTNWLVYHLGGIHSAHILWVIGIVIFAYLLTSPGASLFWFFSQLVFMIFLIYADRNGLALPAYELTPEQDRVNSYSGYILPMVLLTAALAYSNRVRNSALAEAAQALKTAEEQQAMANGLANNMGTILDQAAQSGQTLLSVSSELGKTVGQMKTNSEALNTSAERQADSISSMSGTLQNMARSVDDSSTIMNQIRDSAENAERNASHCAQEMNEAIQRMQAITQGNQAILNTMNVITDIADQTNLLALNAAIEAARAGEQGRGFAVVADEVRSLSIKSNDSAKHIRQVLDQASVDISKGSEVLGRTGEVLASVVDAVRSISTEITNEADKLAQQNRDIAGIVTSSHELGTISQNNAKSSQIMIENSNRLAVFANELSDLANQMHELVSQSHG